jgi:hypothetical protein
MSVASPAVQPIGTGHFVFAKDAQGRWDTAALVGRYRHCAAQPRPTLHDLRGIHALLETMRVPLVVTPLTIINLRPLRRRIADVVEHAALPPATAGNLWRAFVADEQSVSVAKWDELAQLGVVPPFAAMSEDSLPRYVYCDSTKKQEWYACFEKERGRKGRICAVKWAAGKGARLVCLCRFVYLYLYRKERGAALSDARGEEVRPAVREFVERHGVEWLMMKPTR